MEDKNTPPDSLLISLGRSCRQACSGMSSKSLLIIYLSYLWAFVKLTIKLFGQREKWICRLTVRRKRGKMRVSKSSCLIGADRLFVCERRTAECLCMQNRHSSHFKCAEYKALGQDDAYVRGNEKLPLTAAEADCECPLCHVLPAAIRAEKTSDSCENVRKERSI